MNPKFGSDSFWWTIELVGIREEIYRGSGRRGEWWQIDWKELERKGNWRGWNYGQEDARSHHLVFSKDDIHFNVTSLYIFSRSALYSQLIIFLVFIFCFIIEVKYIMNIRKTTFSEQLHHAINIIHQFFSSAFILIIVFGHAGRKLRIILN